MTLSFEELRKNVLRRMFSMNQLKKTSNLLFVLLNSVVLKLVYLHLLWCCISIYPFRFVFCIVYIIDFMYFYNMGCITILQIFCRRGHFDSN